MQSRLAVLLSVMALASGVVADGDATCVEIEGVTFGAKPDERGPIGGGAGYTAVVTGGDFTATTLEELNDALGTAEAGQVVFIPGDAEIDLTTIVYIDQTALDIPAGITLASNRGHEGSEGGLLICDSLKMPPLISVRGPDVRVTGLRIRGPNTKRYLDHHRRAFSEGGGGHKYYYKFPTQDGVFTEHDRLEVDNCDISGFGHAGVRLAKGVGQHIHHNHIHHCQHNGLGYGISHSVASSIIEHNRFDWNRHSIAGTGSPGCGYIARHNVELGTSLSHCFDMHGGRDRKDGTDIAGTSIEVYNNTFRAPQTPIVIRGVPQDTCDVHHNWFPKHTKPAEAVRASDRTKVFTNAYGPEPEMVE